LVLLDNPEQKSAGIEVESITIEPAQWLSEMLLIAQKKLAYRERLITAADQCMNSVWPKR
jgi:hypothetical protein